MELKTNCYSAENHIKHDIIIIQFFFISPTGKYIVCGSEDHFIYIWKTRHEFKLSATRRDRNDYWEAIKGWCLVSSSPSDRSFMGDPLSYFSLLPVRHDWCNKGCCMSCPLCGMVHIKEPLLLIGKSSPCRGCRFPLSLSEWSFTICVMPYNRK